jgi:hypothetical protein
MDEQEATPIKEATERDSPCRSFRVISVCSAARRS